MKSLKLNAVIFYTNLEALWAKILKNNWHWHSLTAPACFLFCWLGYCFNFMHVQEQVTAFGIIMPTLASFIIALGVEIYEGFKGANATTADDKGMWGDILVSTVAGLIGSVVGVIAFA